MSPSIQGLLITGPWNGAWASGREVRSGVSFAAWRISDAVWPLAAWWDFFTSRSQTHFTAVVAASEIAEPLLESWIARLPPCLSALRARVKVL
jgi:hypothetical protein